MINNPIFISQLSMHFWILCCRNVYFFLHISGSLQQDDLFFGALEIWEHQSEQGVGQRGVFRQYQNPAS